MDRKTTHGRRGTQRAIRDEIRQMRNAIRRCKKAIERLSARLAAPEGCLAGTAMRTNCDECDRLQTARDAAAMVYIRLSGDLEAAQRDGHWRSARILESKLRDTRRDIADLEQQIRGHRTNPHSSETRQSGTVRA
jgi:hypothetical protein